MSESQELQQQQRVVSRSNILFGLEEQDIPRWYDLEKCFWEHLQDTFDKLPSLDDDIWGKIMVMERNVRVAKAYMRHTVVAVTGSNKDFDGYSLGYRAFENPYRDKVVEQSRKLIGQGLKLRVEVQGDIYAKKYSRTPVSAYCFDHNISSRGDLEAEMIRVKLPEQSSTGRASVKVFDMRQFKKRIEYELSQTIPDSRNLMCRTVIPFTLARESNELLNAPCWFFVVNLVALDMLSMKLPFPGNDPCHLPGASVTRRQSDSGISNAEKHSGSGSCGEGSSGCSPSPHAGLDPQNDGRADVGGRIRPELPLKPFSQRQSGGLRDMPSPGDIPTMTTTDESGTSDQPVSSAPSTRSQSFQKPSPRERHGRADGRDDDFDEGNHHRRRTPPATNGRTAQNETAHHFTMDGEEEEDEEHEAESQHEQHGLKRRGDRQYSPQRDIRNQQHKQQQHQKQQPGDVSFYLEEGQSRNNQTQRQHVDSPLPQRQVHRRNDETFDEDCNKRQGNQQQNRPQQQQQKQQPRSPDPERNVSREERRERDDRNQQQVSRDGQQQQQQIDDSEQHSEQCKEPDEQEHLRIAEKFWSGEATSSDSDYHKGGRGRVFRSGHSQEPMKNSGQGLKTGRRGESVDRGEKSMIGSSSGISSGIASRKLPMRPGSKENVPRVYGTLPNLANTPANLHPNDVSIDCRESEPELNNLHKQASRKIDPEKQKARQSGAKSIFDANSPSALSHYRSMAGLPTENKYNAKLVPVLPQKHFEVLSQGLAPIGSFQVHSDPQLQATGSNIPRNNVDTNPSRLFNKGQPQNSNIIYGSRQQSEPSDMVRRYKATGQQGQDQHNSMQRQPQQFSQQQHQQHPKFAPTELPHYPYHNQANMYSSEPNLQHMARRRVINTTSNESIYGMPATQYAAQSDFPPPPPHFDIIKSGLGGKPPDSTHYNKTGKKMGTTSKPNGKKGRKGKDGGNSRETECYPGSDGTNFVLRTNPAMKSPVGSGATIGTAAGAGGMWSVFGKTPPKAYGTFNPKNYAGPPVPRPASAVFGMSSDAFHKTSSDKHYAERMSNGYAKKMSSPDMKRDKSCPSTSSPGPSDFQPDTPVLEIRSISQPRDYHDPRAMSSQQDRRRPRYADEKHYSSTNLGDIERSPGRISSANAFEPTVSPASPRLQIGQCPPQPVPPSIVPPSPASSHRLTAVSPPDLPRRPDNPYATGFQVANGQSNVGGAALRSPGTPRSTHSRDFAPNDGMSINNGPIAASTPKVYKKAAGASKVNRGARRATLDSSTLAASMNSSTNSSIANGNRTYDDTDEDGAETGYRVKTISRRQKQISGSRDDLRDYNGNGSQLTRF